MIKNELAAEHSLMLKDKIKEPILSLYKHLATGCLDHKY